MTEAGAAGGLFALAEQKLDWIDARQRVLAQNIANADTPGYQARDLASFGDYLSQSDVSLTRTSNLHLAGFALPASGSAAVAPEQAPDGNAVGLEAEMTKVADGETSQALVGNLWKSYMNMYMTALGHGS
jgi:flagellar basal-body rod protein FlgB